MTTSSAKPTIYLTPGTDASNLQLQAYSGTKDPSSLQFQSLSLSTGFKYGDGTNSFTYTQGDLIFVDPIAKLGGSAQPWDTTLGYTVSLSTALVPGVKLNSAAVDPSFLLKHLAGIRPTTGVASNINSVIKKKSTVNLEYVGKQFGGQSSYIFEADITEIETWNIVGGDYNYVSSLKNAKVVLTGKNLFAYNIRQTSNWKSNCYQSL